MIKTILKNNSITLTEISDVLGVSRPTLDSYIKAFDCNNYLTNKTYNDIFVFLFNNSNITNEEFSERYSYIKNFFKTQKNSSNIESINQNYKSWKPLTDDKTSSIKENIISLLNSNYFDIDILENIYSNLQSHILSFSLVKEYEKYLFYHETAEDKYYLVFKSGILDKKNNSIKIDDFYHYVVYKTDSYEDMCQFIKETIGENIWFYNWLHCY